MDIEIKEVEDLIRDWPALASLLRGLHEHHLPLMNARLREDWEERQRAGIEEQFRDGNVIILLATDAGQPIGFVHGHMVEHPIIEDRTGMVDNAYVRPEARRQGALSALLERIEDWFRKKGAVAVQLNVVVGNVEAIETWEAKEYRPYMQRMRKDLG